MRPFSLKAAMRAFLLLSALTVWTAGCSTGDGSSVTVQVLDNAFDPSTVTISSGTRVNWGWNGRNPHNVVFAPGTGLASSATQTDGAFNVTFSTAGSYNYECTVHPGMTGTVVVR